MDILKMLADLRAEREQVEEAIIAIERSNALPPELVASAVDGRGVCTEAPWPPGSKNKPKEE